jgi:hypothetical protein
VLRNAQCVMKNPFEYGGVVSGHAFCNRDAESADLLKAVGNNETLFVFSELRWVKRASEKKQWAAKQKGGPLKRKRWAGQPWKIVDVFLFMFL